MSTVFVFGTFDGLHEGHNNFFKQAKALGKRLIVSVSRDENVFRMKKLPPVHSEEVRLAEVQKDPFVAEAFLADAVLGNFQSVTRLKPDIIALGYDQVDLKNALEAWLKKNPHIPSQVVVLKPHKPEIYKSSKLRATQEKKE